MEMRVEIACSYRIWCGICFSKCVGEPACTCPPGPLGTFSIGKTVFCFTEV